MKNPITLLFAIGLASCAAPKAIVVEEAPEKPVKTAVADISPPATPGEPNDGLRIGDDDLLTLPSDEQLRPSSAPGGDSAAPVTIRPPKE
ncbi:hypothetical protein HZ994_10970 [Akkermansiaceae bacterium]|nr:hypothetical protein HZ994_10970 [Akkermansiaceae bacterium]